MVDMMYTEWYFSWNFTQSKHYNYTIGIASFAVSYSTSVIQPAKYKTETHIIFKLVLKNKRKAGTVPGFEQLSEG